MFFYSLSVLHGVTDTCSFLDAPFFIAKVFLGNITNFCQLYNLQTQCLNHGAGVYDEFCLVEVLQPKSNLLIGGEHITYIPIVAVNFLLGQGPVEITGHAKQ